jgi:hypothetical protein
MQRNVRYTELTFSSTHAGFGVWETTIDSVLDERIIVALLVNEMQT